MFFSVKKFFNIKLFFLIKIIFSQNNVYFVKKEKKIFKKKNFFFNLVLQQMNNYNRKCITCKCTSQIHCQFFWNFYVTKFLNINILQPWLQYVNVCVNMFMYVWLVGLQYVHVQSFALRQFSMI